MTDPIDAMEAYTKKLIAKNEALCMAGSDLAVALQATRTGAKNAGIFGHQALEQWRKTLIAIEADRLEELAKPHPINLRVVSTNRDHLKVVPQVSCASLDYRDVHRLHADLETLDHEHRS